MRIEETVLLALALDLLLGDPRWSPHPVRLIGAAAMRLEAPMRRAFANQRLAGALTAAVVVCASALCSAVLLRLAGWASPTARAAVGVILTYYCLAARDLADHAGRVLRDLRAGDLAQARWHVSWMVGRDVDALDERGVTRAAVESVAENTVDGVVAPLFFALLGGPVAAVAYKAVSTLDSTFGYKNERYLRFGWASARLDDCAAYLPARLALLIMPLASLLVGLSPLGAWRIGRRDGRKHSSPNSGLSEAAAAGALGAQLGGPLLRRGQPCSAPLLGDALRPLAAQDIARATRLMLATSLLFAALGCLLRRLL